MRKRGFTRILLFFSRRFSRFKQIKKINPHNLLNLREKINKQKKSFLIQLICDKNKISANSGIASPVRYRSGRGEKN